MLVTKYTTLIFLLILLLLTAGCNKMPINTTEEAKTAQTSSTLDQFIIAGSGSNIPITEKLAQSYRAKADVNIEIPESIGSAGAINAVMDGSLDLGLISRPLTSEERAAGLKEVPYAQIAVVFAAHHAVTDSSISSDEIIGMLAGNKTTWSDGNKIYILTRQDNDSTNQALYNLIPRYKDILIEANNNRRWQILYRNSDMTDALKNTTGACGLTTLPEITRPNSGIKPLFLDGIAPTKENVLNGSYKPIIILSFIYKNNLSSRASKFIDFVFSKEGQQTIENLNAIPIGR